MNTTPVARIGNRGAALIVGTIAIVIGAVFLMIGKTDRQQIGSGLQCVTDQTYFNMHIYQQRSYRLVGARWCRPISQGAVRHHGAVETGGGALGVLVGVVLLGAGVLNKTDQLGALLTSGGRNSGSSGPAPTLPHIPPTTPTAGPSGYYGAPASGQPAAAWPPPMPATVLPGAPLAPQPAAPMPQQMPQQMPFGFPQQGIPAGAGGNIGAWAHQPAPPAPDASWTGERPGA